MKKIICLIITSALFISLTACSQDNVQETPDKNETNNNENEQDPEPENNKKADEKDNKPENDPSEEKDPPVLTDEKVKNLLRQYKQYFHQILDDKDKDGILDSYDTKVEVIEYFKEVMSEKWAETLTEGYIKEKEGGLYVIPKDSPIWLEMDTPFQLKKMSDTYYRVTQDRSNQLRGNIEVKIDIKFKDSNWVVDEIKADSVKLSKEQAKQLVRDHVGVDSTVQVEFDHMVNGNYLIHVYDLIDKGEQSEHIATRGWFYVNPVTHKITNMMEEEVDQTSIIKDKAQIIVQALSIKDMDTVSKYTHTKKGLLFSPYVYVKEEALVFQKDQVKTMLNNSETYTWGTHDGSGKPIKLTPKEYYDRFIYDKDYAKTSEIIINQPTQRGNMKNNIKDVFPDSYTIEFHVVGSKELDGMDWASLNLVFEKNEQGVWMLVAIIHDQWTI